MEKKLNWKTIKIHVRTFIKYTNIGFNHVRTSFCLAVFFVIFFVCIPKYFMAKKTQIEAFTLWINWNNSVDRFICTNWVKNVVSFVPFRMQYGLDDETDCSSFEINGIDGIIRKLPIIAGKIQMLVRGFFFPFDPCNAKRRFLLWAFNA